MSTQSSFGVSPNSASCRPWIRRSSSSGRSWSSTRRSTRTSERPRVAAVLLDDEQAGRLLAAAVAAGGLGGVEAVQEAERERLPGRPLEGVGEPVHRGLRDEDVALGRVAGARPAAGPRVAAFAGVRRRASLAVDDAELPLRAALVRGGQPLDDLLGRESLAEQRQAVRAVARVRVRLRRDRADVRLRPGDDRADGEELRLDGDTPLARLEVAGDDRVGGDDRLSHTSGP